MMYTIVITRKDKNPDYEAPKRYSDVMRQPYDVPEFSIYDVLSVEITPEQFEVIRKAALEAF